MRIIYDGKDPRNRSARVVIRESEVGKYLTVEIYEFGEWNECLMGEFTTAWVLERALLECLNEND